MALASFDNSFSFEQDAKARLGEGRGNTGKLTEEERKAFDESPFMKATRRAEELTIEYTQARDQKRQILDPFFEPQDSDWTAPKSYDYDKLVDYYEVLGIHEYATLEQVKEAYKKLSLIYHPDKTSGLSAEQKDDYQTIFIELKNAYRTLSDAPTRRQYDRDRDRDRASFETNGFKVKRKAKFDATAILRKIKEGQLPPGKTVDVPVQCELEEFFYGGTEIIKRSRKVRDVYTFQEEEHMYKIDVARGAADPLESVFREMGDHHEDTKPDTIKFLMSSRPHPAVERKGVDLISKGEVLLGYDALQEPHIEAQVPSIRGRHVLLWGSNPCLYATETGNATLHVGLRGEGMTEAGCFRFACRMGSLGRKGQQSSAGSKPLPRDKARQFLQDILQISDSPSFQDQLAEAQKLWGKGKRIAAQQNISQSWKELLPVLPRHGFEASMGVLLEQIPLAVSSVEGEWGLIARVSRLLSARPPVSDPSAVTFPVAERYSARKILMELDLGPEEGFQGDDDEGEEAFRVGGVASAGSANETPAKALVNRVAKQRSQDVEHNVELSPIWGPINFLTQPACTVTFYSNVDEGTGIQPHSLFAICLASGSCSKMSSASQWNTLKDNMVPLLQATAFHMLPTARAKMVQPLADFPFFRFSAADEELRRQTRISAAAALPVPWKRLGDRAFRQGDFFTAVTAYTKCLEDESLATDKALRGAVLSNRAACFAKVGHFDESLADAKRALDLRPTWARAWSRAGFAASNLGDEYRQEAIDSYVKATQYDPSASNVDALSGIAASASSPSTDKAHAEKDKGNTAMKSRGWGLAVAHYTLAICAMPAEEPGADQAQLDEFNLLRCTLHSNRAAAHLRLSNYDTAVADAFKAVTLKGDFVKAHNRLAAALMGAGQLEQAYSEFARALQMEALSSDASWNLALKGQEACISMLPLWRSKPSKQRISNRFNTDLGLPRSETKVYAISDIRFGIKENEEWVNAIDQTKFKKSVLIVAGNLADNMNALARALTILKSKFRRVFLTPGNHEFWVHPTERRVDRYPDSFCKLLHLLEVCDYIGVDMFPAAICKGVYIVPLLSWYNNEFDKNDRRPDPTIFDPLCRWPMDEKAQVWKYLLKLNEAHLGRTYNGTVISCAHFLPLPCLPFEETPKAAKAMGCEDIEDQIFQLRSKAHVYGHSLVRAAEAHGGVMYINHAHVQPGTEDVRKAQATLLCIFNGEKGIVQEEEAIC